MKRCLVPTRLSTAVLPTVFLLGLTAPVAAATLYEVGPGKGLAELEQVPWELLEPGDAVRIHWRDAPYRGKFVLCRRGTEAAPDRKRVG